MTITLDIRPETQEQLARQAAQGLGVEVFAASLPEKAAQAAFSTPIPTAMAKDMVELFAPVRGLDLDFERDRDAGREINL